MVARSRGGGDETAEIGGENKQEMKKGPWTAAEDAILIEYVRKNGDGNWNAVQRNTGLQRCGKSCRLRWANHLRPNLKKGAFTTEEERLILELHAKLGNKWARMAAQLPGRTDNEIKNYWNTRMKRRQRAGLPLYPTDIQMEAAAYRRQQQQKQHSLSSPPSLLPSFLSPQSQQPPKPSLSSLLDPIKFPPQTHQPSSFFPSLHPRFQFYSPVSPSSGYCETQTPALFSHGVEGHIQQLQLRSQFEPISFMSLLQTELPSSQMSLQSLQSPPRPDSSGTSACDYVQGYCSSNELGQPLLREDSGLLNDLLKEAEVKSQRNVNPNGEELCDLAKGKAVEEDGAVNENSVDADLPDDATSAQSSSGMSPKMKEQEEEDEEMNPQLDEELTSLLGIPSTNMPTPDWYSNGSNNQDQQPNEQPSMIDHGFVMGSNCWQNLPRIH